MKLQEVVDALSLMALIGLIISVTNNLATVKGIYLYHSSYILYYLSRHVCNRILGYPHDRSEGNLRQRNVRVPGQAVEGILGKE
jgi:hypothetical protein